MTWLRSYLFAPGNNEDLVSKVFDSGADAVVLDLEDAVPPAQKVRARELVANAIDFRHSTSGPGEAPIPVTFVRINSLQSREWREDVKACVRAGVSGIRVPKAESVEMFCRLSDAMSDRESAVGLTHGAIVVVATIESARGLAALDQLARAPRLVGFTFGAADFCADVGADPEGEGSTLFARSRLVAAARSYRLAPPIASVFTRVDDDAGLRADTIRQRALGFFGRSAIHPKQLSTIQELFSPTADQTQTARRLVARFDASVASGAGALLDGGQFVDLATVRRARATIELFERQERR